MKLSRYIFASIIIIIGLNVTAQAELLPAPPELVAVKLIQLASFEKNISDGKDLTIYIMGATDIYERLKKEQDLKIGTSIVYNIMYGPGLPSIKPAMIILGDTASVAKVINYTHENNILSATGIPELVERGISLGVGIDTENKVNVLLNMESAKQESLDWKPAIMKIAKVVK